MSLEVENNSKRLVLLVEDDKFLCEIFSKKVSETFVVEAVDNEKDALEIAVEKRPDVILLDLNLAEGNGFDILKKIRRDSGLSGTLVLIITNSVLSEDAIKSSELQADDFITKANFSVEEIIERMEDHLSRRNLED